MEIFNIGSKKSILKTGKKYLNKRLFSVFVVLGTVVVILLLSPIMGISGAEAKMRAVRSSGIPDTPTDGSGCIYIKKETYDTESRIITPVAQFTFNLTSGETTYNDSNGNTGFTGLTPGWYDVSENSQTGWAQTSVVPTNGHVYVEANKCATVVFKNKQTTPEIQNTLPRGYLDQADCTQIVGWAIDFDSKYSPVTVQLYKDGTSSSNLVRTLTANQYRSDVSAVYDYGDHSFGLPTPSEFKDSVSHTIYAYALDVQTGARTQLSVSPKTIPACVAQPPQNPSVTFTANPTTMTLPQNSTLLSWNVRNADVCWASTSPSSANRYWNSNNPVDDFDNTQPILDLEVGQTIFNLRCENSAGSTSKSVTVTVNSQPNQPTDVCPNIAGLQTSVPSGMYKDSNGNCVDIYSPTDVCPNIAGLQTSVPSGMYKDSNGNCVDSYNPTDVCPNIAGLQTSIPSGMHKDSNGNCVDDYNPTDVCPNITGLQTSIPSGMYKDSNGNCVSTSQGNAPTVDLRADDTSIDEDDETTLRWSSTNADYCIARDGRNGWAGNVSRSGTFDTDDLSRDTTYEIECFNNYGSDTDEVTVRVDEDDDNDNEICYDIYATNYRGSAPCRYQQQVCQDPSALNYRGTLPCRYYTPTPTGQGPTVILYADNTSVAYNGTTFVRWSTVGATSCAASGGSTGWAGTKSVGPGSFYTGSLTSSRTYNLTCSNNYGSATDSVAVSVRSRPTTGGPTPVPATSIVLVTSSIDRNQPIVPTLDNTNPQPGDEITYTVNYQNIGTGAIKNLVLRLDLPYEVTYLYSTPNNPTVAGNTLIFSLGTLGANGSGSVTVRVRVRDEARPGTLLNFPAMLSYIDPAGFPQTVTANVSAQVWNEEELLIETNTDMREANPLGAAAFFSGTFWPSTLFGWLLLIILILLLILLVRYLLAGAVGADSFTRKTTTTTTHS